MTTVQLYRGRSTMCPACEREEIRRASECNRREEEAFDRGQNYECTCESVVCNHCEEDE